MPRYFIAPEDAAVNCPSLTEESFCVNGTLGATRSSGGKQRREGNVQVLKLLESPEMPQNVEVSAEEQIRVSSAPSLQ